MLWISTAYATTTGTSSNWYNTPIMDEALEFWAVLDWWKVYTTWTTFSKQEWFVYYKVIRSQTNENPVYPDDWYISYFTDINKTEYVDTKPLVWIAYYRVCAITTEKNRYCSNVIKIKKEWTTTNETKVCSDEYNLVCWKKEWVLKTYWNTCLLSKAWATFVNKGECTTTSTNTWVTQKIADTYTLRAKADKLVSNFIQKVEKLYSANEKRISVLNTVIEKLKTLANNKSEQKELINYIVEKLQKKLESYKWSNLDDIESIFNSIN